MIIAIAGQKGGSGKTTTALNIATEWQRRNHRVLLVDADPQQTLSTWSEVAIEQGRVAPTVAAMGARMHDPSQLPALAAGYSVTVIDCPPRHGDIQRSALMLADLVLVPCGPSSADVWALTETTELISHAQTLRPHLQAALLLTRKMARTAIGRGLRHAVTATGLPVLTTELGYRVAYAESLALGQGVTEHPATAAAQETAALVDELEALIRKDNHATQSIPTNPSQTSTARAIRTRRQPLRRQRSKRSNGQTLKRPNAQASKRPSVQTSRRSNACQRQRP